MQQNIWCFQDCSDLLWCSG